MSEFVLYNNQSKGFTMTFANGITVSVRWGEFNYSNGKSDAEVAAMDKNGNFIPVRGYENHWQYDQVIGHMTADAVVNWMYAASKMEVQ